MRYFFLMSVCVISLSCSSTTPFISYLGDVSISANNSVSPDKKVFLQAASDQVLETEFIEQRGKYYLDRVVFGYKDQIPGINYSEVSTSGIHFAIKSVEVSKGTTFNIIDPGPILKIQMNVDVIENGNFKFSETYITRVNMARVVGEGKFWNWLNNADISNTDNQIKTVERGLRNLYRDLYFKHLDISLEQ